MHTLADPGSNLASSDQMIWLLSYAAYTRRCLSPQGHSCLWKGGKKYPWRWNKKKILWVNFQFGLCSSFITTLTLFTKICIVILYLLGLILETGLSLLLVASHMDFSNTFVCSLPLVFHLSLGNLSALLILTST